MKMKKMYERAIPAGKAAQYVVLCVLDKIHQAWKKHKELEFLGGPEIQAELSPHAEIQPPEGSLLVCIQPKGFVAWMRRNEISRELFLETKKFLAKNGLLLSDDGYDIRMSETIFDSDVYQDCTEVRSFDLVCLLAPSFESKYQEYISKFPLYSSDSSTPRKRRNYDDVGSVELQFTFSQGGMLQRKQQVVGDRPYNLLSGDNGSRRHALFDELVQSKSERYRTTKDLAEYVGCTEGQVRRSMGELRREINKRFNGFRAKDFIDSHKGSGYRINPRIRIYRT